jgi:chromosome segregation ATPase
MTSITLKKEESKILNEQEGCATVQNSSIDDDFSKTLKSLDAHEAALKEQKADLEFLVNQLETKIKEELVKKRQKVEKLNSEVSDLKQRCEKFAKGFSSEASLGNSQAGS